MDSHNQEKEEFEFRLSSETQEIIGYVPAWTVRFGILLIFVIIFSSLLSCYFIKYPDKISTPMHLTTLNSPAPLVSKTAGRIETWFVSDGEKVKHGTRIALLENGADLQHVEIIKQKLAVLSGDWENDVQRVSFPSKLSLGTLQNSYLNFYNAYVRLKDYLELNSISENVSSKKRLIAFAEDHYKLALIQKQIKNERFNISKSMFTDDSTLFRENRFGIPKREYDLSRQSYLQEKENFVAFNASLQTMQSSIVQMKYELSELISNHNSLLREYQIALNENEQLLLKEIGLWSESFLITSPIEGTVTFTKYWSTNQVINTGDRLATIVPNELPLIIGRASVPSSSLSKIVIGQSVKIKLAGFPSLKYGVLNGNIKTISMVPDENGYAVEIKLSDGMVSDYREELKFVREMEGIAEIITEDSRLIYKLLPSKAY